MIEIQEVAERTYRFEAPVPGVNRILAVYIIGEEKGILLDPGPATAIPFIEEAMKALGIKGFSYIMPTHIHIDHAGAMGELAELFPQVKVVLHPSAVRHATDPSRLIESTRMAFGEGFEANYGTIMPVPETQIIVPTDGEKIPAGSGEIKIVYAPGHAPHHIAILDEKTGGLFCGEALGVPRRGASFFPLPAVAPPSFDVEVYLETIEKLRKLKPRILFYAHDGVGWEADSLILKAEENMRIFGDIILKALKAGENPGEIGRRLQEHIRTAAGVTADQADRTSTVAAYTIYFRKKGLV